MTLKELTSLPENILTSFVKPAHYSWLPNPAPERVFRPHHIHAGLSTLGLWEASLFPLATFPGLCPPDFRWGPISFLPFPELLLTLKDVPIHQLLTYSLFSLFVGAEGRALRNTFLAISRSQLCSQAHKTCQLTKQALIQWISLCHEQLIQFTIILSSVPFIPFPKSKLGFLKYFSPGFWKALSTHDPNKYFKKV